MATIDSYVRRLPKQQSPVPSSRAVGNYTNRGKSMPISSAAKKRKLGTLTQSASHATTGDGSLNGKSGGRGSPKKQKKEQPEKRLKVYRQQPPQSFLQKLERAQSQRMVVIGRSRTGETEGLREDIDIVGSTGNIYRVTIARVPECTCPDHKKGHECKHKVYALHTVLKAPEHLQYQRAFLTSELEDMFAKAPPIPNDTVDAEDLDGKRKVIEGECPICYMDLKPNKEELVWCKAGCGNNMHKDCFDLWAKSQRNTEVRCVYCRTPWQMDKGDLEAIRKAGEMNGEGYVNVAEQFGMSRVRDVSSYYQPWATRNFGSG